MLKIIICKLVEMSKVEERMFDEPLYNKVLRVIYSTHPEHTFSTCFNVVDIKRIVDSGFIVITLP